MPEATVEPLSNDQVSLLSPASCFTPPPLVQQIHQQQQQPIVHDLITTPSASVAVLERNWDISDDGDASIGARISGDQRQLRAASGTVNHLETVGCDGASSDEADGDEQLPSRPADNEDGDNDASSSSSNSSSDSSSSSSSNTSNIAFDSEDEARDNDHRDEDYNENNDEEDDSTAEDTVDFSSNANASDNSTKQLAKEGKQKQKEASKQETQEKVTVESLNAFDVLKYYEILN